MPKSVRFGGSLTSL